MPNDTPPTPKVDVDLLAETLPRDVLELAGATRPRRGLDAVVLHHPDLRRVGERARLDTLRIGDGVGLSRLEPLFEADDRSAPAPLADPYLSRRCARLEVRPHGAVRVSADGDSEVLVDAAPVAPGEPVTISRQALDRGVVVTLADRVALLLRRSASRDGSASELGLIGLSDGLVAARAEVRRVAPLDLPVLIRGESGTGKELVAQALHRASRRAAGPLVSVNMAAINPSTAASELFGHARGAFTGAHRAHDGYFVQADGGTLFLDEIGDTPPDLQLALLRVLETGEVHPVGGAQPRKVDVRLVSATDRDLEAAIAASRFRAALYHRLAAYQIDLPPLRDRVGDAALLLSRFVAAELQVVGRAAVLARDLRTPWLSLALARRLAEHRWPGNVRELRNIARQLVVGSLDEDVAVLTPALERLLSPATEAVTREQSPATEVQEPAAARAHRAPSEIDEAALLAALRANRWSVRPTARDLGISKTSLYTLIEQSPRIRKAADLDATELKAAYDACGGDIAAMSDRLEVSSSGLRLRLKELGLR